MVLIFGGLEVSKSLALNIGLVDLRSANWAKSLCLEVIDEFLITEGVYHVLWMASKTDDLLTFVEFEATDRTNLAFLRKIQIFVHVCHIVAELFKQSSTNDSSLRVHRFLLCLLFCLMILSFFDNYLEFGVVSKFLSSILLMLVRFLNVIDVIEADHLVFKLFIVAVLMALITAHRKD